MSAFEKDSGTSRDGQQTSVQDAEPYRTPVNVPEPTTRRGLLGSPTAWFLATGVLLGAVAALFLTQRSTNRGVIDYVEDFGFERRGPIREIETYNELDGNSSPGPAEMTPAPGQMAPAVQMAVEP